MLAFFLNIKRAVLLLLLRMSKCTNLTTKMSDFVFQSRTDSASLKDLSNLLSQAIAVDAVILIY